MEPSTLSDQEDLELVRRALRGETKAFETLVLKYQKTIYNLALRMANDGDDAADITQGVFIKAFDKLGSYNDRFKFFSWLYRIAVNESLNFIKSRRRFESLDDQAVSFERLPDEETDVQLTRRRIAAALLELRPDARIVVILCYYDDLSYLEISRILGIPEKTVKSRLYSARQNLQEILVKKGIHSP